MYNFVYYFFYRYFKDKGNDTYKFMASSSVFLTVLFHFITILRIIEISFKVVLPRYVFYKDYLNNKMAYFPVVFILIFVFYFFYNKKRVDHIVNTYPKDFDIYSVKSIVKILLICLLPLLLVPYLINYR